MKRRILALFLSLCMILAMLPAHAFAQTAEPTTGYLSGSYRNPLYSHDECCTAEGRLEAPRTYTDGTLSEEDYLVDDADVLSAICAGLEQRQATITVPWKISRENISAETEQDDIKSFLLAAFLLAMYPPRATISCGSTARCPTAPATAMTANIIIWTPPTT